MGKLGAAQEELGKSREVCEALRREGVEYRSLDAGRYLAVLEAAAGERLLERRPAEAEDLQGGLDRGNTAGEGNIFELNPDETPRLYAPFRRYAARLLDCILCGFLWDVFLIFAFHANISRRTGLVSLADTCAQLLLMLFLEPLFLSAFKTTPGKWVLGLRVTDNEGDRLTLQAAFARTKQVLWGGMGFFIPIYQIFRLWKSYRENRDGRALDWELDSRLTLKDEQRWRAIAYCAVYAGVAVMLFLALDISQMPKHRGDISVAQLCDNYNEYADYYGVDNGYYLDENGKWVDRRTTGSAVLLAGKRPEFAFTEEDGRVTGVEFSVEISGSEGWASSYQTEMLLLAYSFVKAQDACGPFTGEVRKMARTIDKSTLRSFETSACGTNFVCRVEYSGYAEVGGKWEYVVSR